MAVQIIKTNKAATKVASKAVKPEAVKSEEDILAERIVEIYPALKSAQKIVKGYEADRKLLAAKADEAAKPEDEVTYVVKDGTVKFSAKASQTVITDAKALHEKLGDEAFYKLVKVSIDDLKKYLSASEIEGLAKTDLTGARRISVTVNDQSQS